MSIEPPKRAGVERDEPPEFVTVRICEWCGSQPLADTLWCDECEMHRKWLDVRYRRVDAPKTPPAQPE